MFEQDVKVRTSVVDGDESGNHWTVYYVLYDTEDDDCHVCYDLYEEDGNGNGKIVCRGYNINRMRSLTLRLGEFVEWGVGVGTAA